ncbi:MAG: nucleotide exchange factor GrpE [Mycoplasmataceae bacterium]|nr:nucleotide exchange factor GrpE [Mycoplasmataceae bacterium]
MEEQKKTKKTNEYEDKNQGQKNKQNSSKKNPSKKVEKNEPKINYKEKTFKLETELAILKMKNMNLEVENQKSIIDFQSLAKTFQDKAQEQINSKNRENATKLEEEINIIKKHSNQKLFEHIIEPILNIGVAVEAGKKDDSVKAYVMGFEMLLNQLYDEMESFGLIAIEPKVGDKFDPSLHHAIETVEGNKDGEITIVRKKGFKYNDRIIKPASVVISK